MSVAKPALEYAKRINIQLDWSRAARAIRIMIGYERKYLHFLIAIVLISVLRSYLFTLEPLYTAQIIDKVATQGHYELLQGLVLNIVLSVMGFAATNFAITYLQGRTAQLVIRDMRKSIMTYSKRNLLVFLILLL